MTSADLEAVVALDRMSFSLPWPESSFRFEVEENKVSRCWVAVIREEDATPIIVGMIVIWLIVDEAHVATLAVHPEYRGMGIARRLFAYTLLDAYHSGASRSFLEVRRGNLAAQQLYQQFGFKEVGIRPRYYRDNHEDAVMMNLETIDPDLLTAPQ